MKPLQTPVLFLIFNRPALTEQVFARIRAARPTRLFVAADGPRPNRPTDEDRCRQTRAIVEQIDWDCDVHTLFQAQNLGCRRAVSSAISWFFSHVPEGIILEDDCLPDPSFFTFCEALLIRYRDDASVMSIGGSNLQFGRVRGNGSYYFSRLMHIWGWATWRRAWQLYDIEMRNLDIFIRDNRIAEVFTDKSAQRQMIEVFRNFKAGDDSWDHQWGFTMMWHRGKCIVPNTNLITNIGFGRDATHALDEQNALANLASGSLNELVHPATTEVSRDADDFMGQEFYKLPKPIVLLLKQTRRFLKAQLRKYGTPAPA